MQGEHSANGDHCFLSFCLFTFHCLLFSLFHFGVNHVPSLEMRFSWRSVGLLRGVGRVGTGIVGINRVAGGSGGCGSGVNVRWG